MRGGDTWRARGLILAGHALLVLGFALHLRLDARERDVLSWMDPYQYYEFALGVLAGSEHFTRFEVPSIFPFLLMPALSAEPSIPAALTTQLAFAALLAACVHGLVRELGIATPSPWVALLVLSSPLLIGLSRELYVELALSGVVAAAFLLLLRFLRTGDRGAAAGYAAAVGTGFMLKMTFPLFLLLPVGAVVAERLAGRRPREAARLAALTALPVALALLLQATFFPVSFAYYLSLGNTAVPIMRLIGPPEWWSWPSATFYLGEVGRTLTFLLTPLLVLAAGASLRARPRAGWRRLSSPDAILWLWLLGPLLLLVLQPVKEPRHVAPCVVPAVLLGVRGIERLPWRAARAPLLAAAVLLALVQYGAVTTRRMETPYYMNRSLQWQAILETMLRSDPPERHRRTPEAARLLHWKYDQNVVIAGFPANEALALGWQLFPGVVFDLASFEQPDRLSSRIPYERFEDLYIFTAFNAYNRRCGWRRYYDTLPRDQVVANADFVILDGTSAAEAARRFPDHALVGSVARASGAVQVLRARRPPTIPYRALYAEAFLRAHPDLSASERAVVADELYTAAALGGYDAKARAILRGHPELADPDFAPRNIHWIGGYGTIARLARERLPEVSAP